MGDVLIYFGIIVIGFWCGWQLRGAFMLHLLSEHPDQVMETLKRIKAINDAQERGEDMPTLGQGTELAIERVGNTLYAYAKDTNQFIAQGPSLDMLLEEAAKRFPDRKFFGKIPNGDPAKELVQ